MRRLPLGVWLALSSLGVVLLAIGGLLPAGLALFRVLAEENARARVQLAAVSAADGLRGRAEDALVRARLLAERPTLLGFVANGDLGALADFLARFRQTAGLDGCAVVRAEQVLLAAPPELPWETLVEAARGRELGYVRALETGEPALAVASVGLFGRPDERALAVVRLDEALLAELEERVGLPLSLEVAGAPALAEPLFLDGEWRAERGLSALDDPARLAVRAHLPGEQVAGLLLPLRRDFALATLAAGLLSVAAGVLAARTIARPFQVLGAAALRIGSGDLSTPLPRTQGVEAGALATSMEEMRKQLRSLTGELQRREAEAKALLEGIVEGVFAVDGERRIQYLNPQAAAQLGLTQEQALGRFCGDVLRPAAKDGERPCQSACPIVHARSLGSSRAVEHLELAGGRRTVVITSAPPTGARQVQVMRDETEIEAARRSRDAVFANVSHELKTPLSAQLASIELLQAELEGAPPAALELVAALERSTLRLTRLIDNLLESVRIETGKATFRRVPVELAAVVDEARAMTYPLLVQREQALVVDLPAGLPTVEGDPHQLMQVFVNLLANANKHAPEGSTIWIGTAWSPSTVSLWVDDAGRGVPPAESRSVFDRFHRADEQTEGLGLGLWIVKSIVARHGGQVLVETSPAGGARFLVRLPTGGRA